MGPTEVANQSLARFGAKRINDFDDNSDTKPEALYCRLYYEPTAKALMRSHWWRFAKHRVQLSQDSEAPAFQWTYAYHLPNDFLRAIMVYDGSDLPSGRTYTSYELEGSRLFTDESSVYLKYIRWVSEVPSWDPLFTELMVLSLARKLVIPLSQDAKLKVDIDRDLAVLMRQVRALDRQEQEQIGRTELRTWQDARFSDTA
jgi:hypothetical protein